MGVPEIRFHDLAVEYDETRTTRAAVVSILARYGCRERPQDGGASPGAPLASSRRPDLLSVITAQMTYQHER
jgi:hypothetical protein